MSIVNTNDRLYLKEDVESDLGVGTLWIEFTGQQATRQCEKYGNQWVCSYGESYPGIGGKLCDQPLSEMEYNSSDVITREEFEKAWEKALTNYKKWSNVERNIRRFFKKDIKNDKVVGIVYFAFQGETPYLQCEKYGNRWICSQFETLPSGRIRIIQDKLSSLLQSKDLSIKDEISNEEFEKYLKEALEYYENLKKPD